MTVHSSNKGRHDKKFHVLDTVLQYSIPLVAIFFLFANIALFAYLKLTTGKQNRLAVNAPDSVRSPTPTPTPTPYPLPQGKRGFQLTYGKKTTGPKIGQVTIDPFDPQQGKNQTYTVTISHSQPIVSVDLTLHTDHKVTSYALKRIEGSDTKGTWQINIATNDSHLYQYYAYFTVKSAVDEFRGGLTFRAY